jgi:hypothetical protein
MNAKKVLFFLLMLVMAVPSSCFFSQPALAAPDCTPVCLNVSAQINAETMQVTGTGSGNSYAVGWRVRDLDRHVTMTEGQGKDANFSFVGTYGTEYQLQFRNSYGQWSSTGCKFSFTAPPPPKEPTCNSWIVEPSSGKAPLEVSGVADYSDPDKQVTSIYVDWGDGSTGESTLHKYLNAGDFISQYVLVKKDGSEIRSPACTASVVVTPRVYNIFLPGICNGKYTCPTLDEGQFGFSSSDTVEPTKWYPLKVGQQYPTQPPGKTLWLKLMPKTGYYALSISFAPAGGGTTINYPEMYPGSGTTPLTLAVLKNIQPGYVTLKLFYRELIDGHYIDCWVGDYSLKIDDGGPMKAEELQHVQ